MSSTRTRTPEGLLRWDVGRDEPYLLIPGFPDLRLTPFRRGDDEQLIQLYNDPLIGRFAFRRPYPYRQEHLTVVWDHLAPAQRSSIETLRPLLAPPVPLVDGLPRPPTTVPPTPFSIIRHSSGEIAGHVQLSDASAGTVSGMETVPPEKQVWEVAYNVGEMWRGKGLAKKGVGAVIDGWARWVGIGKVVARVETVNLGSQGVMRSCGFELMSRREEEWPKDKGGGVREVGEWELKLR